MFANALTVAALLLASGCASATDYATAKRTAHRLEMDGQGVCSATAVGPRVLLTAAHCIERAKELTVDGVKVVWWVAANDNADHVLVRVSAKFKHWADRGQKARQGAWYFVHGNPAGDADMLRVGTYAGRADKASYFDLECYRGDSGAAIFDQYGRIVGVVSAARSQDWYRMTLAYDIGFTPEQWAGAQS